MDVHPVRRMPMVKSTQRKRMDVNLFLTRLCDEKPLFMRRN